MKSMRRACRQYISFPAKEDEPWTVAAYSSPWLCLPPSPDRCHRLGRDLDQELENRLLRANRHRANKVSSTADLGLGGLLTCYLPNAAFLNEGAFRCVSACTWAIFRCVKSWAEISL